MQDFSSEGLTFIINKFVLTMKTCMTYCRFTGNKPEIYEQVN